MFINSNLFDYLQFKYLCAMKMIISKSFPYLPFLNKLRFS